MSADHDPGPYRTPRPDRPRIWVPGVLCVREGNPARLELGPAAGLLPEHDSLRDWKSEASLVEREGLDAVLARAEIAAAAVLPEVALAAAHLTALAAIARAAPLVAVDQDTWTRLLAAGARGYIVGYHRVSDGFWLHAAGGGRPTLDDGDAYHDFAGPFSGDPAADEAAREALEGPTGLLDRLLRARTDGVVSEAMIHLAIALGEVLDPAYGPRRSGESVARAPRSSVEVAREARGWDAAMMQVAARAALTADDAAAIAQAVGAAPADADTVAVPVYGVARRERVAAATLAGPAYADAPVVLPAEDHWYVEDVEPWTPSLSDELRAQLESDTEARLAADATWHGARRRQRYAAAAVILVMAALVALAWWLRHRAHDGTLSLRERRATHSRVPVNAPIGIAAFNSGYHP